MDFSSCIEYGQIVAFDREAYEFGFEIGSLSYANKFRKDELSVRFYHRFHTDMRDYGIVAVLTAHHNFLLGFQARQRSILPVESAGA